VAPSAITTIISYTVTGTDLWFDGFVASGTVDAEYTMHIDATEEISLWTSEQNRNIQFYPVKPMKISVGSTVAIKAIHYTSGTADFKATVLGSRY
jgi:hypothetical protein